MAKRKERSAQSDDEDAFGSEDESGAGDFDWIENDSDDDILIDESWYEMKLDVSSDSESEDDKASSSNTIDDLEWKDVTLNDVEKPKMKFSVGTRTAGPQIPSGCTKPIDFFRLFFTDEIVEEIVAHTNQYASETIEAKNITNRSIWNNWVDVTTTEILAFIGVVLNMGLIKLPEMKDYWSQQRNTRIPFFVETFRRDRFFQIFWMLRLYMNASSDNDLKTRTPKIDCFLDYIDDAFRKYFIPESELLVDESIVQCKGKLSFITYNSRKPKKWGIRIYELTDANTGYTLAILPYYGRSTTDSLSRSDLPTKSRIVLHLYKKLLDSVPDAQGHHMFVDRFYTSLNLAEELLKLKCYLTGTIQPNRKHVPQVIRKAQLDNNFYACRSGNQLLLVWKDQRQGKITLLSNYYTSEMKKMTKKIRGGAVAHNKKPNAIITYNRFTNGLDKADRNCNFYQFLRKSREWWKKLFFWGVEMCKTNSYILYKVSSKRKKKIRMTHFQFTRTLVDELVGSFSNARMPSYSRPSTSDAEERLDGKLHILRRNDRGRSRSCLVCSNRSKGQKRESVYHCATCTRKPGLHIGDCFEKYHTEKEYKTQ